MAVSIRAEATRTESACRSADFGAAHAGEQQRQVDALQLHGAPPGQLVVEMLPGAAERLPRALRFLAQPLAVRARRPSPAAADRSRRDTRRCAAAASTA